AAAVPPLNAVPATPSSAAVLAALKKARLCTSHLPHHAWPSADYRDSVALNRDRVDGADATSVTRRAVDRPCTRYRDRVVADLLNSAVAACWCNRRSDRARVHRRRPVWH